MRSSAALLTRSTHRIPRISLRRRFRAGFRALLDFAAEVLRTPGFRRHEDFLQVAAREARERDEAIDGSVGAMSQADIQRISQQAPDRRRADTPGRFPY